MAQGVIDFWFDFPSYYSYIAAERIDAIAARHGRSVRWRVMSLPHLFKTLAYPLPMTQKAKWDYALRDWQRSCVRLGLTHAVPQAIPLDAKLARLVFASLAQEDAARAARFGRAAIAAYWGRGLDISHIDVLGAVAAASGLAAGEIERRATDPGARAYMVEETGAAIAAGVFGAPFFIVDGEPFWGADRLDQLDSFLESKS